MIWRRKAKKRIVYHIDRIEINYSYLVIYGWALQTRQPEEIGCRAITAGEAEVTVLAERYPREDVNTQFEQLSEAKTGFLVKVPLVEIREDKLRMELYTTICKEVVVLTREQLHLGSYQEWFERQNPGPQMIERQRKAPFDRQPRISIVIPAYHTPREYLTTLLDSVTGQSYDRWELCIADGSADSSVEDIVAEYMNQDARIRYKRLSDNKGISDNTNEAIEMASGDWIMFTDHDDVLCVDALYEIVKAINEEPDTDVVYTDEDKTNADGTLLFEPAFKPDFNLEFLRENNYICHIFTVKRQLLEAVGPLRREYDGAQDYDFVLRCSERAAHVAHVAKPLYHWRAHPNSTAGDFSSKTYAFEAGKNAVKSHYERMGIKAEVTINSNYGHYRSRFFITGEPLVSILIANMDHIGELDVCIQSILAKTTYPNYEIVIIENNSKNEETFAYYRTQMEQHDCIRVIEWSGEFNYAAIHNYAAKHAKGEYLLLLNNDIEIIEPEWMTELLSYCQRAEIGAVGAKLLYPDHTIQHAGVIIGLGGVAGHIFHTFSDETKGYADRIAITQELSAVTAACMMTKKSVYEQVGGMEEQLAVAYNDVDYCLKLREAGYKIIYNPYVTAYHYESKSRGYDTTADKQQRMEAEAAIFSNRWKEILEKGDPYYNRNMTKNAGDCTLSWDMKHEEE